MSKCSAVWSIQYSYCYIYGTVSIDINSCKLPLTVYWVYSDNIPLTVCPQTGLQIADITIQYCHNKLITLCLK